MKPDTEKKTKEKKDKRSKKRKRDKDVFPGLRILVLAQLGDVAKAEKYLTKHGKSSINSFDAAGFTPLHQACQDGNREMAELLLRNGADARAEDFKGNTPAHLAAAQGHTVLLTKLLQVDRPPDIDARNASGDTIRELAATATAHASRSGMEADSETADEWAQLLREDGESDDWQQEPQMRYDSGDEWDDRLRQEQYGEDGYEEWTWDSFGFGYTQGGTPHFEGETEDDFAQRIWQEMQRRQQASYGPTAATQEAWGAANEAARQRDARAREAAEQSRRILEEEKAKDAAWREAVKMGNVGARRAAYEARWHGFGQAVKAGRRNLTYTDVPWPADDAEGIRAVILYGASTSAEIRKRVRLELLRWHEDKFAKFKDRLASGDVIRILERVKAVTQILNGISIKA